MTLDRDKPQTGWRAPMSRRRMTIVVVVAAVFLVGAIVAAIVLGIPFF
jgi:hypothetical protein